MTSGLLPLALCVALAASPLRAKGAELAKLHVPEQFTIEKVAGAPAVKFPMFAAFDDHGRLFVAESSGGDLYADLTELKRNCRVSVLEDRDGDGSFEMARVFADNLVFPMGLAWRDGKLFLAQGPEAVALEDTDGDGRADKRTTILAGFGHSDNGSLHGIIFGPDGLLYMTVGQPDGYRFKNAHGEEIWGRTGGLIRCRADGSHPEVLSRGFENLVEIVFLPTGEIIGDDNWFQVLSAGVRDALVHLVEGGKYPRMPDNGSPLPRTGGDLPALSKFPAVAFSGLMQYRGSQFPAAMRGNLFAAQFNARRVQRHVLTRDGSSFRSENIDFVTSDDPDFHPSDVLEVDDGSMIIIDTGAWYVQHCPTGKIRDSYVPGGIYRVRYTGAPEKTDESVQRLDAQWTEGSEILREKLLNADADVAALAARILGSRADRASGSQLAALLKHDAASVRLAAAEALSHCGDAAALPAVWEALPGASDQFIEHALIIAALHLADEKALRMALESPHLRVQKAALLLLDQAPYSALDQKTVMARLSTDDAELRETVLEILRGHVEWADEAVDYLRTALSQQAGTEAEGPQLQQLIIAFQAQPSAQDLIAESLTNINLPPTRRAMLLDLLAQTGLGEIPGPWIKALGQLLDSDAPELRSAAVRTSASLQIPELDEDLATIANDRTAPATLRLDALRGIVPRHPAFPALTLDFLREQLAPSHDAVTRLAVAQVLARARLNEADRSALRGIVGEDPLVAPLLFPVLAVTTEQQRAQLAKYEPLLTGGDPARGRDVFAGRVGCIVCHRAGQEGGQIGPDLTKIGAVRSRRDLIESIVLPSATFAQGYEPYLVTTNDGLEIGGIVSRQSAEAVFLRAPSGAEQRLPRKQIAKIERSTVSVMPPGLDLALSAEEFRNLLAYLESLR